MTKYKEWNEFIMRLRLQHWEEFKKTREYDYRKQREEALEGLLEDNLNQEEKDLVDSVIWELGKAADQDGADLYIQGMRDCVWMLKTLGVLA